MGRERKPSSTRAIVPFGKNGDNAFDVYKRRLLYKDAAYPELPPDYGVHEKGFEFEPFPIDMWYDKPYFGRYDLGANPIYLLEENLKQIPTENKNETFFAINFVVDAFEDLQKHYTKALNSRSINKDFPLSNLPVAQAYISPDDLYQNYINNLFQVFVLNYLQPLGLHCTINNFSDFLGHLRDYFSKTGQGNPLTFSGFIGSKRCPTNVCGLFIDLQPSGFSDDAKKYKDFLIKNDFSFFISSAKNHGFLVDKNVPWRLVADISSPKMREYMKNYQEGLNKDNLFSSYYKKAYATDIKMMMNNIIAFYNNYVSSRPYNSKPAHAYTRGDVGTTKEVRKTITRNKLRDKTGIREILDKYGEQDVLDFYFLIKTYETGMKLTDTSRNAIIEETMARKEALGLPYALSFLNKVVTDQIKINLTIGAEYVKGNNNKATQLLNARQPKDDEPNIKDVISGDYSRK
jgi:hypothetical protein